MKKKTYLVPVTAMLPVTIYYEEMATSPEKAREQVKKSFGKEQKVKTELQEEHFFNELGLGDVEFWGNKVKVLRAEDASLYHTSSECEMCTIVKGNNK